jgi:hypothetical protein
VILMKNLTLTMYRLNVIPAVLLVMTIVAVAAASVL